jgi:L-aspartate oxidase
MASNVAIFKTSQGLVKAERRLKQIFLKTNDIYNQNKLTLEVCELRNMVSVAYLMIKQSQEIKENIGVFYNHDNVA